ncbi:DUF3667 domain-containing protein [Aliidiomarina indica]|uniref:DUF3667 domain-containing protein n=1 Tax=Aliidiomarina indica TaxID=2749147 RepID=UPI00188F0019|nr:DUF3667 domain-containing protein [Aliidiomarina indica]
MTAASPSEPTEPRAASAPLESTGECANCGAQLKGPFCHECGQENKNYIRNVFRLITELFGEMGNWDGRFWRTLIPLFTRPAFLSNQYVKGKRIPYVPPLRLYIFISLIAFILFASLGKTVQQIDAERVNGNNQTALSVDGEEQPAIGLSELSFEDSQLNLGFLSEADNAALNERFKFLLQHPRVFVDRFFSLAPQLMLVMLPIFALLLKLLYAFSGRYYVEHLVLALHTHAFLLLTLMFIMGLKSFMGLALPAWLAVISGWLYVLLWWWIPVYLVCTQKRFYRQSWPLTFFKFSVTSLVYFIVLLLMLLATIILSVLRA